MSKSALPQVIRVYCEDCKKLIPKKTNQSWKDYSKRKFCNKRCLAVNQSRMQIEAKQQMKLPDGTIMPLGNYIKKNTNNLRDTVDFYIGVIRHMKGLKEDSSEPGRYKGIEIDKDLVKLANTFLVENSDGKPGQRKEKVEEPAMSREELVVALEALEGGE